MRFQVPATVQRCEYPVPHPTDPRCPNGGTTQIQGKWYCLHHAERITKSLAPTPPPKF